MKVPAKKTKKAVKKKAKKKVKKVCRKVRVKGTKRYRKVCKPVKKKKKKVVKKKPVGHEPCRCPPRHAAAPPVTTPPGPGPPPPVDPPPPPPGGVPVYDGPFGVREAQRLLWRAGFGPRPGEAEALAGQGLVAAVRSLTRPSGAATLVGAAPALSDGTPFAPLDAWGHDHLWWLDRMVRSNQPLVERMTLILHDWFATSNGGVGSVQLMFDQNELLRSHALGSFTDLVHDITATRRCSSSSAASPTAATRSTRTTRASSWSSSRSAPTAAPTPRPTCASSPAR